MGRELAVTFNLKVQRGVSLAFLTSVSAAIRQACLTM